ncbi:bifunctional 3-(3-hydroxy-phenyl)propionate/3-hydroxycinnamic acid hydroxylase MhpA [Nocardioides jensenii]|uniref:bifunctional 3-(3-hydroxy-phenyl)propionate/3-hydroxycinnamic acid hydroxylase MhpA n=1 Tax=Nocardioides jensenii TaxID=1843 RepID=UPI00082CF805|nr:bifunctional 3-(3-hydroxy-phenyl)propionate/3-hydroxycinnamic acid hydroxylase [Nocardioides jensenii]
MTDAVSLELASDAATLDTDVLIVGAGPVGLSLANLLGRYGQRATLMEARDELIDYPRGVGLDDESFRTIQAMDLVEQVRQHTVPTHIARLVNGSGQVLVENNPTSEEFGWPRKSGFIQQLVDRELCAGLSRYEHVDLHFGHELVGIDHRDDHVVATFATTSGTVEVSARYLVGSEGGRSFTRGWMDVEFEGKSPSTRWLVVDVNNDPLGTPNVYLGADPRRPYVSIGLPHAIRRWEFMLFDDEPTELVEDPAFMHRMLADHVPDPTTLDVIDQRVFTHHGRIATSFRQGRVLIAGDAAHLMPVWLGQGWNSGIRDATNLAWKLTSVLTGACDDSLLDSYDAERRSHAQAMIDINMTAGSIMKLGPVAGRVRDLVANALNVVPSVKSWFTELRFKPMPRYDRGVVVDQSTGSSGNAELSLTRRLLPFVDAPDSRSPVGLQFIQPRVNTAAANDVLLDEATGNWWTIAAFGNDPTRHLTAADLEVVRRHGINLVAFVPETQRAWAEREYADSPVTVIGDAHGRLKQWFDNRPMGVVFLRPDRFVAAVCLAQETSATLAAVLEAMSATPSATEGASDVTRPRVHVAQPAS